MENTLQLIAKEAGVSTATVSRVFSHKDYVRPETAETVLRIAKAYGYKPKKYKKATAQSLYHSTIVVMFPEMDNSFYCNILTGIQSVLDNYEIDILVSTSNNNSGRELHLLDLFDKLQVSGLIVVPCSDTSAENIELYKKMHQKIPVIMLDRYIPSLSFDGVFMENYKASCIGTELLIQNGHRDIAYITGSNTSSSTLRLNGFRDTMDRYRLQINEEHILHGEFNSDHSYRLTKELLQRELQKSSGIPDVTAIFTASSKMLSGALLAIAECGLRVPDDIAVLTFGETFLVKKNISYIKYPAIEMGEECARILLERLQIRRNRKKFPAKNTTFDTSLELFGSEKYPSSRIRPESEA